MLQGDTIICHPEVADEVRKILDKETDKESDYIFRPYGINIVTDEKCEKEQWSGKWIPIVQNDRFTEWYELDLEGYLLFEPSSWMIHFNFVKKEMIPVMYMVNTETYSNTVLKHLDSYWTIPITTMYKKKRKQDIFIPTNPLFKGY